MIIKSNITACKITTKNKTKFNIKNKQCCYKSKSLKQIYTNNFELKMNVNF